MYLGYNTQKTLQDERVRDLLEQAQPYTPQSDRRIGRLFTMLRSRLTVKPEASDPCQEFAQEQRLVEQQ